MAVWLRKTAPPEAARLLPESDAIVYVNLRPYGSRPTSSASRFHTAKTTRLFVDATGIDPERDLDAAAFALHRMDNPNGPNGPVAYSEVFEGRFDGARLARYLSGIAASQEEYAGHTVYTIPIEGRQLRIAQLGYDTIAASNMPTPEQIHAMLDRYRASASPFSGSSLLAAHYRDVPLLSSAWGIGHVGLPFSSVGTSDLRSGAAAAGGHHLRGQPALRRRRAASACGAVRAHRGRCGAVGPGSGHAGATDPGDPAQGGRRSRTSRMPMRCASSRRRSRSSSTKTAGLDRQRAAGTGEEAGHAQSDAVSGAPAADTGQARGWAIELRAMN